MEEADGEVLAARGGREDMRGRDPPENGVPAVALGSHWADAGAGWGEGG